MVVTSNGVHTDTRVLRGKGDQEREVERYGRVGGSGGDVRVGKSDWRRRQYGSERRVETWVKSIGGGVGKIDRRRRQEGSEREVETAGWGRGSGREVSVGKRG